MPRPKPNHTGKRFGRLVATKEGERHPSTNGYGRQTWFCQCDCGGSIVVLTENLISGRTRSCGCLKREDGARLGTFNRIHGMSNTSTHKVWAGMMLRCTNTNEKSYKNYGGRGIKVCEQWTRSFETFLADMGERPSPRHSIERIDNHGDYCASNCKWATRTEQARNKRNNCIVIFRGESMTLPEAIEKYSVVKPGTAKARFYKGWSIEEALLTPSRYDL